MSPVQTRPRKPAEGPTALPGRPEGRTSLPDRSEPATLGGVDTRNPRGHSLRLWLLGLGRSFGYAFAGLAHMLRTQRNAQIHSAITLLVVVAGIFFRVTSGEWLALVLAIALVLSLEALNTAIEAVVDLAAPGYEPLAKRAKDAAAGAVLVGAIGAAVAGLLVFVPRLWAWLSWLLR